MNSYPRGDKDKGAGDHLGGCQKCHLLPSASVIGIVIITIIIVIFIRDSTTTIILIAVICILGFGLKPSASYYLQYCLNTIAVRTEVIMKPILRPVQMKLIVSTLTFAIVRLIMMRAVPTNHAQHVKILSTYINSYLETDKGNGAI